MEQRSDKNNIIYKVNKAPPKEKCSICNGNLRISKRIYIFVDKRWSYMVRQDK
jgi:hypothetical protein